MAYSLNQHKPRPDIKVGVRLSDQYADSLLPRIKELLRHKQQGFPGSQPVDFESRHTELLENEDYYVRDKTDGKRYIMFFTTVDGGTAFMMDELCKFRILTGFKLPLRSNPNLMHHETMMDGEVVMDIENNKQYLRYLIFDLMVLNGSSLMERPYNKRLGSLRQEVLEPLEKNVEMKNLPITMEIKSMELSYGLTNILQKIPTLKYGNDGLIFVPVNHSYEPGICKKLLLWKPITQLTVDFMIKVPYLKDEIQLLIFDDGNHKFYDYLTLESDIALQWQKNSPDGKIATFWYDKHWKTKTASNLRNGGWRFIKFVHGTSNADHERVVERVWKSIQNAVSQDMLESRKTVIRENWKRRHSTQFSEAQPLPSPTSQVQTPSINNVLGSSIPSNLFWNYNNTNNNSNTQLVSPINSSEPYSLFKEGPSDEQIQDRNIKSESTDNIEDMTRSKFSKLLVTSPGKKSPEETYNNSDGNGEIFKSIGRSYFPPIFNVKPDQNSHSHDFEEKKSPDQIVSTRPFSDTTCTLLNDSVVSTEIHLEKQSPDDQYSTSNKGDDPIEISVQSHPSPKKSPTTNHDHSLPKSNVFLKDPTLIRGSDIINHSSKLLEQSKESNDEEVVQVSSGGDLSQKEHQRISLSSEIVDNESNRNLNEQRFEHESNLEKGESEYADSWNQPESHKDSMPIKGQKNYLEEYWANFEGEDNEKGKEGKKDTIKSHNYTEGNNTLTQMSTSFQEQTLSSQDAHAYQQLQQEDLSRKNRDGLSEDYQPIKQNQSQSSLGQEDRLNIERSQIRLTDNESIVSNLQNNNQDSKSFQKRIPENQEIPFHPSVSSQKVQVDQLKKISEPQKNVLVIRPQALMQENRKVPINDVQHAQTQINSFISRGQTHENNIPTTSLFQQYQLDNQSNSTKIHVSNQKSQPTSVHSQLSLQPTNRIAPILVSPTRDIQPNPQIGKATLQDNSSISKGSQPQLSQPPVQESRSTIISQPRRQTISDSRSIVTSQPRQIHTSHSVPVQMRAPLQENRLMNPSQTQTQLMDSSIFQSQIAIQETRPQMQQTLLDQQSSNSRYIDKQRDSNMVSERINHNDPIFRQELKPLHRRHTLSGTSNHISHQNFTDPYNHQRQLSTIGSSYPPPRQEILSSNMSFALSQSHDTLSVSTIPQGSSTLSQIPEECANFAHNLPQQPFQTAQQMQQNMTILRPTSQKRKSKGALDFILNSGGEKRSKYDDKDNDAS